MRTLNKCTVVLGSVLSVAMLTGCDNGVGNGNSSSPQTTGSTTSSIQSKTQKVSTPLLGDSLFAVRMGSGYDTVTNTATSGQSCLAATSIESNMYIANPTTMINFEQQQGLANLQNNLGVDVSGKYGGDRFSVSAAAQFATDSKDSGYTTNLVYLYKYAGQASFKNGALNQGDAALTPTAASLVHKDQVRFRQMCGNSYVEQMDAGATLAVRYTLSFHSHADQERFRAKMDMTVGLANIAGDIQQAANNSNVNVGFSISAIQMGGQPEKLNNIFGQVESTGNYPFVDCGSVGGSSQDSCNHMTSAIITYAKSMEQQLTNPDGNIAFDRLYYNNPAHSDYSTLGIAVGAPDPSKEVLEAMRSLTHDYDKAVVDYQFVTHYLNAIPDYLDAPTLGNLKDAANRLNAQVYGVYRSPVYKVLNCYKGDVSEDCLNIKSNVDDAVKSEDFALTPYEAILVDYLEKSSYTGELYIHDDSEKAGFNQFVKKQCVLIPISSPSYYRYALNCEGKWMKPQTSISVYDGFNGQINVKGLSYTPVDGTWNVYYFDTALVPDALDPNTFANPLEVIRRGLLPEISDTLILYKQPISQA